MRHKCRVHDHTARRSGHERFSSVRLCLAGKIGPPVDKNGVNFLPVTRIILHKATGAFTRNAPGAKFRPAIQSIVCSRQSACSRTWFSGTRTPVTKSETYVRKTRTRNETSLFGLVGCCSATVSSALRHSNPGANENVITHAYILRARTTIGPISQVDPAALMARISSNCSARRTDFHSSIIVCERPSCTLASNSVALHP
jgi:hypothetical protein